MRLNLTIDQSYLVGHTLSSMSPDRFSSSRHKKDIVSFQNYAWSKSEECYNFIIGRTYPEVWIDDNDRSILEKASAYLSTITRNQTYKKIYLQTKRYLEFCNRQWIKNYHNSVEIISNLTGLNLDKTLTVYITHPSLKNGAYLGNNKVCWGHKEEWPNYTTVYLWHEILHSYFSRTDFDHALILLIADNELRIRLNGDKYPPFEGQKTLFPLANKLLSYWKEYLFSKPRDIMKLRRALLRLKVSTKETRRLSV